MVIKTQLVAILSLCPFLAFADNAIHPGTPVLDRPTLTVVGIQLPVTGDDNFNAAVSVRYRQSGTTNWFNGLPLFRVHPENTAGWTVLPQFAGSIFDLRPATTYDIELYLTDPDGPVNQKFTLTATTRPIPSDPVNPRVMNINSAAGLLSAINAARPGDIITVADGVYNVQSAQALHSGTALNPIVIRGKSEEGTILDGGNCPSCNILEIYGSFVHIEQMTLRNAQRAIRFQTNGEQANVVRRLHITNTIAGINTRDGELDFYIADNILEGRIHWPLIYTDDNNAHTSQDGILVDGFGNVVCHNRISGFADAMKIDGAEGSRAIDFYGNEVLWSYDNGVELDTGEGNVRFFRNRTTNTFSPISVQPVLGGPAYIFRNVVMNSPGEQLKFHALAISPKQEPNGVLVYHNTFISPGDDLYMDTGDTSHHFRIENNLFIGNPQLTGTAVKWGGPINDGIFDYNGYYRDGPFTFNFLGSGYRNFANFAATQAGGVEPHGLLLNPAIFANGLSAPLTYRNLVAPPDVTLAAGSNAIDRGMVLPNINDGFTGSGPDLGAYEGGCSAPIYGVRPQGTDETNEPFGCSGSGGVAAALESVSISPGQVSSGQQATGIVLLTWPAGPDNVSVTLSSSSNAASVPSHVTVPQGSSQVTFPITTSGVTTSTPVTVTASYLGVDGTAGLVVNPPATGKAAFSGTDTSTGGTWISKYGSEGYIVVSSSSLKPSYVTPVASGNGTYTWTAATTDARALQNASGTNRLVSAWYGTTFTIDLNFSDGNTHRVAVYSLDWDGSGGGRRQTMTVVDANNSTLDTQNLSNFRDGIYATWNLSGHVKIVVATSNPSTNAVVNGIFFGPAGSTNAAAQFITLDRASHGNWKSRYGADGYTVVSNSTVNPVYTTPVPTGLSTFTWATSTMDVRAPRKATASDRIVSAWTGGSFTVDLSFTDKSPHQVALYCLDWDGQGGGRRQTVTVTDPNGTVLDAQALSNFTSGQYLIWNLSGHVKLVITSTNPSSDAVVNGIFFGGANPDSGTAQFIAVDATAKGNWKSKYGTEGYTLVSSGAVNPDYVIPAPSGNSTYTWTTSTDDVRAPQKANASGRIVSAWYGGRGGAFTVDLNFSDLVTHEVAIYCLDWDGYGGGRQQTVAARDANNKVLDTRALSGFGGGKYLVWYMSGHIKLTITSTNPASNAVISGIFFGQ